MRLPNNHGAGCSSESDASRAHSAGSSSALVTLMTTNRTIVLETALCAAGSSRPPRASVAEDPISGAAAAMPAARRDITLHTQIHGRRHAAPTEASAAAFLHAQNP
ncbi:hypothetical protein CIHG_05609 [Coccidioides immitis H538.4]|uniref:Uncharacterized protein n=1 Tax=Coccidioides immitis H538.4 TaxID=396776 RepID=A0A0J8RSU2_COCIT|nr:hypothetical protein CIHG_05609 [Coccidioides immitis H538.4]